MMQKQAPGVVIDRPSKGAAKGRAQSAEGFKGEEGEEVEEKTLFQK